MQTQIKDICSESLKEAAEHLARGQVVAFPTETVYGLGANALDAQAVLRIFKAKGRPADNPLIVHVSSVDQVAPLVEEIPPIAQKAMQLWPGPLTLVMKKSSMVPDQTTAGLSTVGIRLPKNQAARDLIDACGCPIAAPSANVSGRPSPTTAQQVLEDMQGRIPLILDGGACEVGVESTVLDVTGPVPVVLRPGGVTLEQLLSLLGEVQVHAGAMAPLPKDDKPASPGMKYRHYAPTMPVYIAQQDDHLLDACLHLQRKGYRVAVLVHDQDLYLPQGVDILPLGIQGADQAAAQLYTTLRQCEQLQADVVLVQALPSTQGMGLAVMNRLLRAAGFRYLYQKKILMVCTGNTCRSPMAHAMLADMLAVPQGLCYQVESGGIAAFAGDQASVHSVSVMQTYGIDLTSHCSRLIQPPMIQRAALILCMTASHRDAIRSAYGQAAQKTFTLGEYAGTDEQVPDPFGGDRPTYQYTAQVLHRLCGLAAKRLMQPGEQMVR